MNNWLVWKVRIRLFGGPAEEAGVRKVKKLKV